MNLILVSLVLLLVCHYSFRYSHDSIVYHFSSANLERERDVRCPSRALRYRFRHIITRSIRPLTLILLSESDPGVGRCHDCFYRDVSTPLRQLSIHFQR